MDYDQHYRKDGKPYTLNGRKELRAVRKLGLVDPVEEAFYRGMFDYTNGKPYRNPYPAGKRHNAYDRGFRWGFA
jgi:hypothetical protein